MLSSIIALFPSVGKKGDIMARKIVIISQDLFDFFCLGDTLFIAEHLSLQDKLNAITSVLDAEVQHG